MKVLVGVKRVIDYNVKIRVKADNTGVETANVKMSMNPFDEIAVEEAIRMRREATESSSSLPARAMPGDDPHRLRHGRDRGVLVRPMSNCSPLASRQADEGRGRQEQPGLVIVGKQAIDDDSNQTGQMRSRTSRLVQGTFANKLHVADSSA